MEPDDNRLDMLRESIRLTEEILDNLNHARTEHPETRSNSVVAARLTRLEIAVPRSSRERWTTTEFGRRVVHAPRTRSCDRVGT